MFLIPTKRQWSEWSLQNKLTALGLFVTVIIFLWHWQESRSAKAFQRPWIVVTHVTSPDGIQVGIPLKVVITFKNTGNTPATNVQAATVVEWLSPGKTPSFSYQKVNITSNTTIGVGGEFLANLYPTKDAKGEIGYLVSKDFDAIVTKSIVLFVHGHISYNDTSGRSHWTDFCSWLSMRRTGEYSWNAFSEHNGIDKNDL